MVSGTVTLTVDGKDHKLVPGSYFELTGKKPHVAKVEGNEEAVFFIQSDWTVGRGDGKVAGRFPFSKSYRAALCPTIASFPDPVGDT